MPWTVEGQEDGQEDGQVDGPASAKGQDGQLQLSRAVSRSLDSLPLTSSLDK